MSTDVMFPAAKLSQELADEGRGALLRDDRVFGALLSENAVYLCAEWDAEDVRKYGARAGFIATRSDTAMQAITDRAEDAMFEREEQACRAERDRARAIDFVARLAGVMTELFPVIPARPQRGPHPYAAR